MAITVVGSAQNGASTGTAVSITHGLTILEDDVVIALVHINQDQRVTDNNGANSFIEEFDETAQNTSGWALYSRVAGSSEPAAYSWTIGASEDWTVLLAVYRGVDTADIWDIGPTDVAADSDYGATTFTFPEITTTVDGAMAIAITNCDTNTDIVYSSPTNSYTIRIQWTDPGWPCCLLDKVITSSGATDVAVTSSDGADFTSRHMALNPLVDSAVDVVPTLGTLEITGHNPVVAVAVGDWEIGAYIYTTQGGVVAIQTPKGGLSIVGNDPGVTATGAGVDINATLGTMTILGYDPVVQVDSLFNPTLGTMVIQGFNPTVLILDAGLISLTIDSAGKPIVYEGVDARITGANADVTTGDDAAVIVDDTDVSLFVEGTQISATYSSLGADAGTQFEMQSIGTAGATNSVELFPRDVTGKLPGELV